MDKNSLMESALKLKQVSVESAEEFMEKAEDMTSKMNKIMLSRTDLTDIIGEKNISMMQDNHANHARFLSSIFLHYNADVFIETILWVFRAYRSHGFTTNYWAAQLNNWIMIFKKELSPECFKEIYPYYDWMQINIPLFVKLSDEKLDEVNTIHL